MNNRTNIIKTRRTNNKSNYTIRKKINGKLYYGGSFKDIHPAMKIKDLLVLFEWDVTYTYKNKKHNQPKFISKNKSSYYIQKKINSKQYNFGSFKTLEEALEHIEFLEKENWDTKYSKHYKNELPKYILHVNDKYAVHKKINGKTIHFGTFNTLEEAIHERDLLIKYKWNYDLLIECEDTN